MSADEVAELAEAIHSHADALYESWTKGSKGTHRSQSTTDFEHGMKDTLELLADPQLTPTLEQLVSNFVKQDKAKRLQGLHSPTMGSALKSNSLVGRGRSVSPKLSEGDDPFLGNSTGGQGRSKTLPKSILEVVQRFEAPPIERRSPSRVPSPSQLNALIGVGPVTSKSIQEKLYGPVQRHIPIIAEAQISKTKEQSPQPIPTLHFQKIPPPPLFASTLPVFSKGAAREHLIPIIQKNDEERTSASMSSAAFYDSARTSQDSQIPANNIHIINVNMNAPAAGSGRDKISNKSQSIQALEKEEQRLFEALRTGQVTQTEPPNISGPSLHRRSPDTDILNNNSRIAFAKERIRQSQENPLTQQRLQLQKRLPAPSSNLAAAIALQQGKDKFKSNGDATPTPHTPNTRHHHIRIERENHSNPTGGRHCWTNLQRLSGGPSSSVADRVQLFEKYPTHIVSNGIISPAHQSQPQHHFDAHSYAPPSYQSSHVPKEITHPIVKLETHYHHNSSPIGDPPKYESHLHKINAEATKYEPPEYGKRQKQNELINSSNVSTHHLKNSHQQQPDFLTSKHGRSPTSVENSRRSTKESVPRFYWPEGKPPPTAYITETISKAESEFCKFSTSSTPSTPSVNYEEFGKFLQSLGISLYWKKPFWAALGLIPSSTLQLEPFKGFYRTLISQCPDEASRFMRILWTAKTVLKENGGSLSTFPCGKALDTFPIEFKKIELQMTDFVPMIQDIIDTHPGLGFLREAPEFHSRYVTTVISRIFYKVNRSWSGRLTLTEIRRSNLLRVIKRLEEETDVNAITDYFSYEHFYVIYCKFWELDKDHDLLIDKIDLSRHNDQALSSLIVDRIFSGTVLRGWDINSTAKCPAGKMTYSDFVWFIISEEDKKDPTATEYWFRCLDLDGDGILSPYELQYFYREQESRIMGLGIEPLDFTNIFCQMVDMLRCSSKGVRLTDLKKNPQLAATFFNTLFNLDKYLDHEQRDPFASSSSGILGVEIQDTGETDWDRFAATEYELLIAEESPSDHIHNDSSDFEELPS